MPNLRGTAQYRFRAGFDGIGDFAALEISGGGEDHKSETLAAANQSYDDKVKGKVEVSDLVIKLALGYDQVAIDDLNKWFDDFFNDVDPTRRGGFAEDLDETGTTPVLAREFVGCFPVKREHDQRSTDGKGVATISFTIGFERVYYA
jgi:hypothetical protein